MEMVLINQRHDYDCVIASIAMFAGKTYDDVFDIYKTFGYTNSIDDNQGIESVSEFKIMRKLGIEPFEIDTAFGGVRGILSLPSLNVIGGAHACYFDGRDIYDPQTGREGKKYYKQQLDGHWPSCYRIVVDLKDSSTLEMVKLWMKQKQSQIERFENGVL